jgi:uncharacterized membrane protein YraQ (UPF0718 family)
VAGIIAAFVPGSFFRTLFPGSGTAQAASPGFLETVAQALVGPAAAFFTFIGSMGNIPLASLLFDRGVSFAGVMAFIFSDLVVLPVLRINARYYGWRMSLYILVMLLGGLVLVSVSMHYGLLALDLLPVPVHSAETGGNRAYLAVDYGFVLNAIFLVVSAALGWLGLRGGRQHHHHGEGPSRLDRVLTGIAVLALIWLAAGLALALR